MTSIVRAVAFVAAAGVMLSSQVSATGHGPLFGGATPVLGKGAWSFDAALMGRSTEEAIAQSVRTMISFGVTADLQVSASVPFDLGTHPSLPGARVMAAMSPHREVELVGAWRIHTRPVGIGGRVETTTFVGWTVPVAEGSGIHPLTPSVTFSVASGYASRGHYLWGGAGRQQYRVEDQGRPSNVTWYSAVYGYRPPAWRVEYPKPDVRLFAELVGERIGRGLHHGLENPLSGGHVVFAGPTVLALYKQYGVQAGILVPVHRRMNADAPRERFRFGVNFAYFFWLSGRPPTSGPTHAPGSLARR